jgi:hypothetical protein
MFDVIWTDPNVEHVGQRALRKEQEAKGKDKKKAESGRQSVSTASSSSSERGFGLFASKNRKTGSTPARAKPTTGVHDQEAHDDAKDRRTSMYGVKAALANQDEFEMSPIIPTESHFLPVQQPEFEYSASPRGM